MPMETNTGKAQSFDFFYNCICHICKIPQGSEKATKFCSGCKLIQYCSVAHQKQDWPKHKDFCKAISVVLNKTNCDHVFKEAIEGRLDQERWNKLRVSVIQLLEIILKRPLLSTEAQILLFPALCNFSSCYQPKPMFPCEDCNSVLYCSKAHKTLDVKHKQVCHELSLSYHIDVKRYSQQYEWQFSDLKMFENVHKLPSNMRSLFCNNGEARMSIKHCLLSEPLSYFLGMAFVLNKFAAKKSSKFTVHIVGADSMEYLTLQTLPYIMHLLPGHDFYRIILIGPGISKDLHISEEFVKSKNCSVSVIGETVYHNFVQSPSYEEPDLIAAFNCGFCEFTNILEKDTWKETLFCIMNSGLQTQILVTSYTEEESVADLQRLCESSNNPLDCKILIDCQVNPFGSLYPHRDWENDKSGVFYVNKYMSVVQIYTIVFIYLPSIQLKPELLKTNFKAFLNLKF